MTCHDFQIGQHLSKKFVICWVKLANFGRLLSKLFTEKRIVIPYRLRQIPLEVGLCKSRILNILRNYKYYPYKTQCHQQIFAVDEESKSEICYEMQEHANDHPFLSTICFTDESTFTLNNEPNVQNTRYWAQENLRVNIPTRTRYPQKIHIWAGIFNNI
jgi:hypothetical protein